MALVQDHLPPPDHASRRQALIGLQIFLVVIALVVYSLRIYTRARILRSIGTDDWIMGAAMLVSIALSVNSCISTKFGWGGHLSVIPFEHLSPLLVCIWISEILFTLSTSLVKISILFFYLRLAVTRTWKRVVYSSIAFLVVWIIAFTSLIIFQCNPVSDYWDPLSTNCYPAEIALFIHGLTNTVTDIYVYVLPMRLVWKTHLPKRQRIGLLIIFGAGFLVCIAGCLRLYYSIITQTSDDSPWEGFAMYTWESVEVNLGIVCASAPCLKSLIQKVIPKFMASHSGSTPGAGGQYQFSARRNPARGPFGRKNGDAEQGYILDSAVTRERDGSGGERESQEELAKGNKYNVRVDASQRV